MIEVRNLTKKYGNTIAVDNISFSIQKGEIVGLLGPNGAGKSTTMRMMTCYILPTFGTITVAGFDCSSDSLQVRKRLGYLSENAPLYDEMNVWEYLEFAAEMQGISKEKRKEKIERVLDLCGIKDRVRQDISQLSKGYRQRVGLAQSLIHEPEILILDEPTTGLDPNQRVEIRELIRRIGKERTIILSSHVLSEVEATCDRVLIIHKGKIVASGTPQELRSNATSQTKVYLNVEGDGEELVKIVKSFSSVKQILETNSEESVHRLVFEVERGSDIRKELVRTLVHKNFGVMEVYQKDKSLEDIFMQLTKQ